MENEIAAEPPLSKAEIAHCEWLKLVQDFNDSMVENTPTRAGKKLLKAFTRVLLSQYDSCVRLAEATSARRRKSNQAG